MPRLADQIWRANTKRADARTFYCRITRQQFRELPLRWIATHSLDGPALSFAPDDQAPAAVAAARIEELAGWLRKTREVQKRIGLARAIREQHLILVELARGYTWPGNPPGFIEFAPDGS